MGKKLGLVILAAVISVAVSTAWASDNLKRAKSDYQFQLDTYREAYEEYVLKRTEFQDNDTFANQEAMVKAAREMLVKRARVWRTYWQVIKTELWEEEGMANEMKDKMTRLSNKWQGEMSVHEATVSGLTTRQDLLVEANRIDQRFKELENDSYQALMELEIARFDWALRQLKRFNEETGEAVAVQVRDEATKQVKQRAVGEVKLILDNVTERYQKVVDNAHKERAQNKFTSRYTDITEGFSLIYADVLRAYALIEETSEGLVR